MKRLKKVLGISLLLLGVSACAHRYPNLSETCLSDPNSGLWNCSFVSEDGTVFDVVRSSREMGGEFGAFRLKEVHHCFKLRDK